MSTIVASILEGCTVATLQWRRKTDERGVATEDRREEYRALCSQRTSEELQATIRLHGCYGHAVLTSATELTRDGWWSEVEHLRARLQLRYGPGLVTVALIHGCGDACQCSRTACRRTHLHLATNRALPATVLRDLWHHGRVWSNASRIRRGTPLWAELNRVADYLGFRAFEFRWAHYGSRARCWSVGGGERAPRHSAVFTSYGAALVWIRTWFAGTLPRLIWESWNDGIETWDKVPTVNVHFAIPARPPPQREVMSRPAAA